MKLDLLLDWKFVVLMHVSAILLEGLVVSTGSSGIPGIKAWDRIVRSLSCSTAD